MNRELLEYVRGLERRISALERQERPAPVVAVYRTSAGQSIPSGGATNTVVNFDTQIVDTHSAVTTGASWQFVAPLAGSYLVAARVTFDVTTGWAEHEIARLRVAVNGTLSAVLGQEEGRDFAASAQFLSVGGPAVVLLAAGDVLDIRALQVSGGSLNLLNNPLFNHVGIFRIH